MELTTRRKTLRMISNGMYVLTSRCGDDFGAATITWVSQASFKPPLLMAAVRTTSNVYRCLVQSRVAALHVLGCDQKDVAQKFFFPTKACAGQINGEPFLDGSTGVPVLQNVPAYVECRVARVLNDLGDHAIVVLEAVEAECRVPTRPLTVAESPWEYGG
jgi:flavin reductase (DIM6/NTAB) family NADH-FMN oxidoreductase RutF